MKIENIDKNFKERQAGEGEKKVYKIPGNQFNLKGCYYDEKYGFIKMNADYAGKISEGVAWGTRCTAGARLLFSTDSDEMSITAELFKCEMTHMPLTGSAGFTLCECVGNKEIFVSNFCPAFGAEQTFTAHAKLGGGKMKNYILYFPLYSWVINLSVAFSCGSRVTAFEKYKKDLPVLYYGSSITQGGCASRPDTCYQARIGRETNVDFVIHGYSGNAKAEPAMCEFLKEFDCSVFVCDYDHNADSADYLEKTHLPLYKKFRENPAHKNVPIIFLTKPDGLRDDEGARRAEIIKSTYEYAFSSGDENVYFIDGRTFYPKNVSEHCAVDGVHPTDLGFYFMAKSLLKVIKSNNLLKLK